MNDESRTPVMQRIADHYGLESRMALLEEECAELIQAISKLRRAGNWPPETPEGRQRYIMARTNLSEEMADVQNLLLQTAYLLGNSSMVEFWWDHKLERTIGDMKKEERDG
ncbi:MAG: hypothetical protein IKY91_02595 [Akkermansia sp.]|nr:hypothetical protein [Akkermansia sp.]